MTELNVILETPTHKIETAGALFTDNRALFSISSLNILVNDSEAAQSLTGDFIADISDNISISAIIENGESISYPGIVLKMPVIRFADGKETDDEIYWNTTIIDGVMTSTGSFPRSGDWKFVPERINQALQRASANWKISMNKVTFLV